MTGAPLDQGLAIELRWDGERVTSVILRSRRLVGLPRVFEGQAPDRVIAAMPRLFALCGRAHRLAAALALGAEAASPEAVLAVEAERIREWLLQILLVWPTLVDEPPRSDAMRLASRLVQALLTAVESQDVAGARTALTRLEALVAAEVLGEPPAVFAARDADALAEWVSRRGGRAAAVVAAAPPSTTQILPPFLPPLLESEDLPKVVAALDGDAGWNFVARPQLDGRCRRTGVIFAGGGALPVLGRILLARLRRLAVALAERDFHSSAVVSASEGWACVDTARGWLVHRAALEAGRVVRYRILAPTEWNCHPQGVAARLLRGLQADDAARLRRSARWVLTAVDPCITAEVRVCRRSERVEVDADA